MMVKNLFKLSSLIFKSKYFKLAASIPKMRLTLFILLLFLCIAKNLSAQRIVLEKLSSSNFSENTKIYTMDRDSIGFLWLGSNIGLFRYDGENFDRFNEVGADISCLLIDRDNNLWVSSNEGLYKINDSRDSFQFIEQSSEIGKIETIELNSHNEIHVLGYQNGIFKVNDHRLIRLDFFKNENKIANTEIIDFSIDFKDHFWLRENNYIDHFLNDASFITQYNFSQFSDDFLIDLNTEELIADGDNDYTLKFVNINDKSTSEVSLKEGVNNENSFISAIFQDANGFLWHAFYGGLINYNPSTQEFIDFGYLFKEKGDDQTFIYSIFQHSPSTYFLGSTNGLYKLRFIPKAFNEISRKDLLPVKDVKFFSVRALHTEDDQLYIGSYSGFFSFNLMNKQVREYEIFKPRIKEYSNPHAYQIVKDGDDQLILASETGGVQKYTFFDTEVFNYRPEFSLKVGFDNDVPHQLYSILIDDNRILTGGLKGLYQVSEESTNRIISSNESFNNSKIYALKKVNNRIFAGTTIGLFEIINEDVKAIDLLENKNVIVNYIYSEDQVLWIGTRGDGLIKYNLSNKEIVTFNYNHGLIDLTINAIIRGNDDGLWFSTNFGIGRLDKEEKSIDHFFINNELSWSEFNHNAIASDDQGTLYFGGVEGIVYFKPSEMIEKKSPSALILSKVSIRNAENNVIEERAFNLYNNDRAIHLGPYDEYFSVRFSKSTLEYSKGEQYSYRINGSDWINIGNSRTIQFTGLNPGTYNLEIRSGEHLQHEITPLSIPVIIDQVFYKQWWAITIYAIALLAILAWIFRNLLIQSKLSSKLVMEQAYSQKLQDLAETKTQIFSNLAHEFQTPLTLIQGPAIKIKETSHQGSIKNWADTILYNSKSLMEMIQQLLKLSRMDEGKYEFKWKEGNLMTLLRGITMSFQSFADERNISLDILSNTESLWCRYDEEKMQHILMNLISNAIKFNKNQGQVNVVVDSQLNEIEDIIELEIQVVDTGLGIHADHLPHIFDRFYQEDASQTRKVGGTGIGLSLVKEFVNLLNGKIGVESVVGQGTTFSLQFQFEPVLEYFEMADSQAVEEDRLSKPFSPNGNAIRKVSPFQEHILIVEDNDQVRSFIKDCIPGNISFSEAEDGEEGLLKAVELIPDLIIMDVMMPKKDGFTLASELKEHPLCSHIPCIMLTAKSSDAARLEGRKSGVEVFLTKPFHPEELKFSVNNLLSLKKKIAESSQLTLSPETGKDEFMVSLTELLDRELDNASLNVEMITTHMAISRTQLHRKVKSISGKSINQYIREYRLEKARLMLLSKSKNVSEVCYEVGFAQPSYFAARYKEYFGELPSESR
jgi:signal transduction histidine kinase/DNA-binding response OmpR family regulator/ligand-binding sensor domain-containing protein